MAIITLIFFFIFFYFTAHGYDQFPSWMQSSDQNLLQTKGAHIDVVVAADGTGNYTKVIDAVQAAPERSLNRFIIHIKGGVYYENVVIDKNKWNIVMIGDGINATIISSNLSFGQNNLNTYDTATFTVRGRGFMAQGISFQNTAGPENLQAVAVLSDSDFSVFYQCGFFGYQDTLGANSHRQFYRECVITGTVDIIFGYATAVFQKCQILVKKGLSGQENTITAQAGKYDLTSYGFSFQYCNISADLDLLPVLNSTQTFLGRPWKPYSTTIFMQSYISEVLSAEGWLEWNGTLYLDTLNYVEYNNYGPGAGVQNRVIWTNYHVLNDSSQASKFTVAQFILGNQWLPSTSVPYNAGLTQEI